MRIFVLLLSLGASIATIVFSRRQLPTSAVLGLVASLCIFVASLFSVTIMTRVISGSS